MNKEQIRELAIKRHDIDAIDFQTTYENKDKSKLSKKETAFLYGRNLVIQELSNLLETLPPGLKVLDVGCGTAHLTNWIKEKGNDVTGIEPSIEMYNFAKVNFPHLTIVEAISSNLPFPDNYFDLIVSFEVLRYLSAEENIESYKEFKRVLKPGGNIFVTQVNKYSFDYYFVFHKIKSVYCKLTNKIHHHCNFTTPKQQHDLLIKKLGYSKLRAVGRFLASIRLFYKFGKPIGNLYSNLIEKVAGKKQRYEKSSYKKFCAHLIIMAQK
jgi:ubiquinone/menaquinone biosynthesis C-methylase UbiE